MTLGEQVADLQERIRVAQQQRMRAEAQAEVAETAVKDARAELNRLYGITTTTEAQEMLLRLQDRLTDIMTQVEKALTEVGA